MGSVWQWWLFSRNFFICGKNDILLIFLKALSKSFEHFFPWKLSKPLLANSDIIFKKRHSTIFVEQIYSFVYLWIQLWEIFCPRSRSDENFCFRFPHDKIVPKLFVVLIGIQFFPLFKYLLMFFFSIIWFFRHNRDMKILYCDHFMCFYSDDIKVMVSMEHKIESFTSAIH